MGNHNSSSADDTRSEPTFTQYVRSKLSKSNLTHSDSKDTFIINHLKSNQLNDNSLAIESLDDRRLIFVNLSGFYHSWKRVPSVLLYTSLCLIPLQRKWIQRPLKYIHELAEHLFAPCQPSDISDINAFIELLRWKDRQGLVLWVLDEMEDDNSASDSNSLIAPFWFRLSEILTRLYDHIGLHNYEPLNLDERYWQTKCQFHSKYQIRLKDILTELYFVTLRSQTVQEIIVHSNPQSLRPVIEYGDTVGMDTTHTLSPLSPIEEGEETETCFSYKA